MVELFLMIGLGAVIVCFLKGYRLYGILTLIGGAAAVVGGFNLSDRTGSPIPIYAGILLFLGAATFGAFRPALSESWWRRSATHKSGRQRDPGTETTSRRLLRAGIGAILGTLPGLLFIFGILIVGTIRDWSSDSLQSSFAGIPFVPLGFIVGAVIGYLWVPRKSAREPTSNGSERENETPDTPRDKVSTGAVVGVLAGIVLVVFVVAVRWDSSVVTVASDHYAESVELAADQTLKLVLYNRLPADNTNWEWFVVESGVVELVSVDLETMAENESVSGDWTFMFTPVETGTADLVLIYRVPGQPDIEPTLEGADSEYTLSVTVTEGPKD
jgi:hypothetical protein